MELHPILENDTKPNPDLWYVLSALGDSPSMRVGHTCTFVRNLDPDGQGKVYVIGGADPSGSFGDVYVLDLDTLQWDNLDTPGFKPRYEHVAFIPEAYPDKIYIFGGADQTGNLNDVQILDLGTNTWSTLTVQGTPPSPRTHHTTAVVGDKLIVYSGGHCGAEPVGDRKLHILNITTSTWSTPSFRGDPPKPRHGHVMVAVGNKVYVHGGMASTTFYDDLHILDLEKESWTSIKKKKTSPSGRAAHGGVACGTDMYLFGGMNKDGALDDMYKYDTVNNTWSIVKLEGPPPPSRLDFGICMIDIVRPVADETTSSDTQICQTTKDILDKELKPNNTNTEIQDQNNSETTTELSESLGACNIVNIQLPQSDTEPATAEAKLPPSDTEPATADAKLPGSDTEPAAEDAKLPEPIREPAAGNAKPPEIDGKTNIVDLKLHESVATKTVVTPQTKHYRLCLVNGGMDTQGEIFDDTLVMLLN